MGKIFYEHRVYESVDDGWLSWVTSEKKKRSKIEFMK